MDSQLRNRALLDHDIRIHQRIPHGLKS